MAPKVQGRNVDAECALKLIAKEVVMFANQRSKKQKPVKNGQKTQKRVPLSLT